MSARRYLSQTTEFAAAVERRRSEAMRRVPWPHRIFRAALDGYRSELRHMLEVLIYLGHGR